MLVSEKTIQSTITSFQKEVKQQTAIIADQDKQIQKCIDEITINTTQSKEETAKGNSSTNPTRGQIKAMFDKIQKDGGKSKSFVANMQVSFWLAFKLNVPFKRSLFNEQKGENVTNASKEKKVKTGEVIVTNLPALLQTLKKAIVQARELGQGLAVGQLIDICLELDDKFKE